MPPDTRRHVQAAFAAGRLWVSTISTWEVALLVTRGRLDLTLPVRDWVARSESLSGLRFLPIDNGVALRAVELAGLHADPADRFIIASAEALGATLVTRDQRLRAYGPSITLWE